MELKHLLGRKIAFFRATIEPGILTMPKNALHHTDKDIVAMEICEIGIYVKTRPGKINNVAHNGLEHIVPFNNCQTVRLLPEEEQAPTQESKPTTASAKRSQTQLPRAQ